MKCPICSSSMSSGKVFLEKSAVSALAFGFGSRELFFRCDADGRKHEEMGAWDTNAAFKCEDCGALLIAGDERN